MEYSKPLMSKTQNICLVILWILFILLAVIMGREIINKKRNEKLEEYQEIALDDEKITLALAGWVNNDYLPDSLLTKIYAPKFLPTEMTQAEQILLVLGKAQLIPACEEKNYQLSLNKLNELLAQYLTLDNLSLTDFLNLEKDATLKQVIKINLKEDNFEIANLCQQSPKKVLIKYLKAYQNQTYLKVTLKAAFRVENETQGEKFFNYYEDYQTHNIQEKLYLIDEDKINWDNYATYEFLFKIKNNNYFLEEVNKL